MVEGFESAEIFDSISKELQNNKALNDQLVKKTKSTIVFDLKNPQNNRHFWKLDLKGVSKGANSVQDGDSDSHLDDTADLVISMKDADFKKLYNRKANSQMLYMGGKLKVKGDVMKATSIEGILKAVGSARAKL